MPHEIERILAAVAGRVWLIDEDKGAEIAGFLALRAAGEPTAWDGAENAPIYAADPIKGRRGPIHVLRLHGTIMPRGGMMTAMSGGASLEQFGRAFDQAADDASAEAIVIDVDSPGGDVSLVSETAEKIYKARRAGRPIIAVANTLAASAAYWIASAADELIVTPSGAVGSVGVYGMHDDLTAAFEKAGIKRTLVRSGPRKAEGVVGGLDDAARAHRQASADYHYDMFVKAVARNRGVEASVVRADPEETATHFGGGRAYPARLAVRLGMADRVESFESVVARLARGRPSSARTARARLAVS